MKIHQLIKSPQDILSLFEEMVSWTENPSKSLWKEEDYPKLKPYFDFPALSGREMIGIIGLGVIVNETSPLRT